jgi:hypothetical protein
MQTLVIGGLKLGRVAWTEEEDALLMSLRVEYAIRIQVRNYRGGL